MSTLLTPAPRVWIGCLACYNDGRLVGEWVQACDAAETTLNDIHDGPVPSDCEEMWVMDTCNMPVSEEMSPQLATEWSELLDEVGQQNLEALGIFAKSGIGSRDGDGLPSADEFQEYYSGQYDSWDDFVQSFAADIGLLDGIPDDLADYFDFHRWGADLECDYYVAPATPWGVHVFRSV